MTKNYFIVTDVLPYELPLIYNNFKFNNYISSDDRIDKLSIMDTLYKYTRPIHFNIWKSNTSQRVMSLLNPLSQVQAYKFISMYNKELIDYCNMNSSYSLRYPSAINQLSVKLINKIENEIANLLEEDIELDNNDNKEYLDSFFQKKKYSRITSFYKSNQFTKLETRYKYLKRIDIKNCFAHIYTHSIDWAFLGNRELAKLLSGKKDKERFSALLDTLMQRCNYNETNGIVIGPEFSRYVAEIVLMRIDNLVRSNIEVSLQYKESDFKILRYIDDIFIFANNLDYLDEIHKLYEKNCNEYKLDLNTAKVKVETRPFIKERMWVPKLSSCIDKYFVKFKSGKSNHSNSGLYKSGIGRLNISFINDLRWVVSDYNEETEKIISYILSAFNKRITELLTEINDSEDDVKEYCVMSILDILHYSISLSITSPHIKEYVKLLIKINNFVENQSLNKASNLIFSKVTELIKYNYSYFSIELLDLILFMRRYDKDLPETLLVDYINKNTHYLTVGTMLFYINTAKRKYKFTMLKQTINSYLNNLILTVNEKFFENEFVYQNRKHEATYDFIVSDLFMPIHDFFGHPCISNTVKEKLSLIQSHIDLLYNNIKDYSEESYILNGKSEKGYGVLGIYLSYIKNFSSPFMDYNLSDKDLSEMLVYKTTGVSNDVYSR